MQLIDAIVSCVATETWAENGGGEAEVRWIKPGFLVVSQTQAVHEEVRALLATIRDVRKRPANAAADAADSAAADATDANRVTTRYYSLKLGESANPDFSPPAGSRPDHRIAAGGTLDREARRRPIGGSQHPAGPGCFAA